MVTYRGVLNDRHMRAVARLAMRARGFSIDKAAYGAMLAEQWELGRRLRDEALPERLPPAFPESVWNDIAQSEPRLWERMPLLLALGHRQTRVLGGLLGATAASEDAALLGGTFNAAIAVLDHLLDERDLHTALFGLLRPELVRAIFDPASDWESDLTRACAKIDDPALRFFFALFACCGIEGRALHRRFRNDAAWRELGLTVRALLAAEYNVSAAAHEASSGAAPSPADTDIETKSALPSVAMLFIAALGSPDAQPGERERTAAKALGQIFWRADELVDLVSDCRRGEPSALVHRLDAHVPESQAGVASDADLYDVLDLAAGDLSAALDPAAFGATLESEDAAVAAVVEFARMTAAAWLQFQEEPTIEPDRELPAAGPHATRALEMLLAEQRREFRESVHHLTFPRMGWVRETHPAWVSFRAVALDALIDAHRAGLSVPEAVLAAEAMTLLRGKHRLLRGGWNYTPDVPELPPDTDDLGQVTQVLYRLGGQGLSATCDEGIRLALDASEPDGGIHTWILDPRVATPADAVVREYLGVMGGWGVHPEVVANFLYALLLADPGRYALPLQKGVEYLESVQAPEGFWPSKWYQGPWYGTYRAVAVLTVLAPDSEALARARTFLTSTQPGDPLSTAFACLALALLGEREAAMRAEDSLLRAQESDGGFPACTWIAFPTMDGPVNYGSRTMTTAFAVKAILALRDLQRTSERTELWQSTAG